MTQSIPTLEDLRHSNHAAWLWDASRSRLVWANAAGIRAFDGQSVFDLIDRAFDRAEPGIMHLANLVGTLKRDQPQESELAFPSLGKSKTFTCTCNLHALADGRDGILAVAVSSLPSNAASPLLWDDLPMATVTLEKSGAFGLVNSAAQNLFDSKKVQSLDQLLHPASSAEDLLQRLHDTSLISTVATFESHYGQREARLTLRRSAQEQNIFAVMVLDDITERRALERQIAQRPGPQALLPLEKQAFEDLGRKLHEAVTPKPIETAKPITPPKLETPNAFPKAANLPASLKQALEKNPSPFAIMQAGAPAYLSESLATLLGYATPQHAAAQAAIWKTLTQVTAAHTKLALPSVDGTQIDLMCTLTEMPWLNGKAQQFTFEKREAEKPSETPSNIIKISPANDVDPEKVDRPSPDKLMTAANVIPILAPQQTASEQELRSILDIASDGIITLNSHGHILSFSAGAEAIFGYRSAEVLHRPLADYLNPDSAKTLKDYLAGLEVQGLASVFNDGREVQAIVKQGGTVPLFLNIGRLQLANSKAVFCAVLRDITSWKRTEQELRQAKDAAEEASRHKSDFLARVSHELRTPLNAILGFSDIMRLGQFGELKNEKYRAYVNDIHASGGHLLAMINDLLDLSKIESGRMELNFTAVNLNDCFDHASRQLQEQATRARVLMRKSFPENLPRIVADQRAMRQIMNNLLSNAIKYTDAGGQVIVSATLTKNGALTLRMKDTGIGMKAEELAQALLPFSRVETPGRERQGTGLGLPLTKALVEANRAEFMMSSEPGQGTLVEITFPTTRVLAE